MSILVRVLLSLLLLLDPFSHCYRLAALVKKSFLLQCFPPSLFSSFFFFCTPLLSSFLSIMLSHTVFPFSRLSQRRSLGQPHGSNLRTRCRRRPFCVNSCATQPGCQRTGGPRASRPQRRCTGTRRAFQSRRHADTRHSPPAGHCRRAPAAAAARAEAGEQHLLRGWRPWKCAWLECVFAGRGREHDTALARSAHNPCRLRLGSWRRGIDHRHPWLRCGPLFC